MEKRQTGLTFCFRFLQPSQALDMRQERSARGSRRFGKGGGGERAH